MTLINANHEFVSNRVFEQAENKDGDKAILAAIRKHRYVYHNYIINRLKSVVEIKIVNFFWSNTWEHGRIWTENETTISFLSKKLGSDIKDIHEYLTRLRETGFLKRSPYGNKSYKYSLDFECEWVKFIIMLEEETPFRQENDVVDNPFSNKVYKGEIPNEDSGVMGGNTQQRSDPIYIASYSRFLKESKKEKSPLFDRWKKHGNKYEEVVDYIKQFTEAHKLDWQSVSFMSKQDDMDNVYQTLKIAHKKLSNGFRPRKSISAYVCTLIKKKAGRERLNKTINIDKIQEYQRKYKLKIEWTKSYAWLQKGNDRVDVYFRWETKSVEDILDNVVRYIHSTRESKT